MTDKSQTNPDLEYPPGNPLDWDIPTPSQAARARNLHRRTQKVRDGQGTLLLFSQFPQPDARRSNQRGYFLRSSKP